nr:putative sodium/metabolite cotransporter BASS5, chloroplastic [Tanacetum cinerariifolium]
RVEAMVVEDSRRRGRPKLRWEDRLKMDMKELRLSEDMTSDRNAWRDRIRINRGRICLHFTSPIPRPGGIGYVVVVRGGHASRIFEALAAS